VRAEVLKSLESARQSKVIGKPTDARVGVQADAKLYPLLKEYEAQLPELFIVSQVAISNHAAEGIAVQVDKAAGVKCQRCWKFKFDVGSHTEFPTICDSCATVVETDYPNGTA